MEPNDRINVKIDLKEEIETAINNDDFCKSVSRRLSEKGGNFNAALLLAILENKLSTLNKWDFNDIAIFGKNIDFDQLQAKFGQKNNECNKNGIKKEPCVTVINVNHLIIEDDKVTDGMCNGVSTNNYMKSIADDSPDVSPRQKFTTKMNHCFTSCLHRLHIMPPDYEPPRLKIKRKQASKDSFDATLTTDVDKQRNFFQIYLAKMKGKPKHRVKLNGREALASFLTSFLGMVILTAMDYFILSPYTRHTLVIGSFAATAVLTFAAVESPLAQPKNVFFGHIISALAGVSMQIILGSYYQWLAAALAVSLAIFLMCLTDTVHPPGGATALIAVYSEQKIHNLKYLYALIPVASGALILLIVALLANNLFPWRKYPRNWN